MSKCNCATENSGSALSYLLTFIQDRRFLNSSSPDVMGSLADAKSIGDDNIREALRAVVGCPKCLNGFVETIGNELV